MKKKTEKKFRILVTAGPTIEPIDPVRFISNFSTGTMGYRIAEEAVKRGHKVWLVSGPVNLLVPGGVEFIQVDTALKMRREIKKLLNKIDCVVMSAAVADFRPAEFAPEKIKKKNNMTIKLVKNPDILKEIAGCKRLIKIGFALETNDLVRNAEKKIQEKKLDLIVANRKTKKEDPFGEGKKTITFIRKDGTLEKMDKMTKGECAVKIMNEAERIRNEKKNR